MSKRTGNGSDQWLAGEIPELVIPLVTAPLTLTNDAQAVHFVGADASYCYKVDAKGFRQCRLTGFVKTVSASANTPKVSVGYLTAYSATPANYLDLGTSEVAISTFTGSDDEDSGWIDLAEGAKAASICVALLSEGGDGAADPVVNAVMLHFR